MIYRLEDIAQEIVTDLNLDIAPTAVVFWIRNNLGALNNLIYTSYSINDSDGQISPDIGIEEIAILKKLYELHNQTSLIRNNLGASSFNSVVEVSEAGNKVRMVNKTEMGKIHSDIRSQISVELNKLINSYLLKQSGTSPVSVDGVDGSLPETNFYTNDKYSRVSY
jgi:hypothetical protein